MLTAPTNLSLLDWASQAVTDLSPFGIYGRLENENAWQDWAAQFLNSISLGRNIPDPYQFSDWREWAERLYGALQ